MLAGGTQVMILTPKERVHGVGEQEDEGGCIKTVQLEKSHVPESQ